MSQMQVKRQRDYVPAVLYTAKGRIKTKKGKNAKWYAYYAVRNPDTGKMEYDKMRGQINYIHNYKQRLAAGKILVDSINKMLEDGDLNPFKPKKVELKLIECFDRHTEFLKKQKEAGVVKLRTYDTYKCSINLLITWLKKNSMENILPSEFTRQHAQLFCEYMMSKKYAGVTFNNRKGNISQYFNVLIDNEDISVNPFIRIKSLPEVPQRHTPYTKEQVEMIDKHMIKNCYNLWVFKQFVYFCLPREEEITKFQVRDINTELWYVNIHADVAKTKVQRIAVIPVAFRSIIRKMKLQNYPSDHYIFSRGLLPGPVPISRNRVTDLFLKKVKIPLRLPRNYTLYGFKHTANSRARELGISTQARQWQNGHSTESQTRAYDRKMGFELNEEFASKMR